MSKLNELMTVIYTKLVSLPELPGQGIFGSCEHDTLCFTVSMYENDMPKKFTNSSIEKAATEFAKEYVDVSEIRYSTLFERIKGKHVTYSETNFYAIVCCKYNIIAGTSAIELIYKDSKFKSFTRSKEIGKILYVGSLGTISVFVNPYMEANTICSIDGSVVDFKYEHIRMLPDQNRIDVRVSMLTNTENVRKHIFKPKTK